MGIHNILCHVVVVGAYPGTVPIMWLLNEVVVPPAYGCLQLLIIQSFVGYLSIEIGNWRKIWFVVVAS